MRYLFTFLVVMAATVGLWVPEAGRVSRARAQEAEGDRVSFARLGASEQSLRGPFDAGYLDFNLPPNWELTGEGQVELSLSTFFAGSPIAQEQPDPANPVPGGAAFGGTLRVVLNDVTIGTLLLDQAGERTLSVPIDPAAWAAVGSDGRHTLSTILETDEQCGTNQYTSVVVRPSSALILPHRVVAPPTDLARLPQPLLQRSFEPDSIALVVADTPTAEELQAALTVAAGLGRMARGPFDLRLVTAGQLSEELRRTADMVVVGTPKLPLLKELQLPAPPAGERFAAPGAVAGDGVIQMAVSPWNDANVVLVVGGDNGAAVTKAAQAVSSGAVQTGERTDLALVGAVQPPQPQAVQQGDRTFGDLGYDSQRLFGVGGQYAGFHFDLPAGQTVGADAYLDLAFVHTALLDYDQSSITVALNDEPVASVRLDDNSTRLRSVRLALPAGALRPGSNHLTLRADLLPRGICADPRGSGLWLVVRPESTLHLPLSPSQPGGRTTKADLARYPLPLGGSLNLGGLAFVLQSNDPFGWDVATQLARDLGRQMEGGIVDLRAAFGEALPADLRGSRDLLLVGRPSALPLIAELGNKLPLPFPPGSNLAADGGAAVVYRLDQTASVGYLQLLPSPWASERTILAVLGSSDRGLRWAATALTEPRRRVALKGDVAVIRDEQIESRDTRVAATEPLSATTAPDTAAAAEAAPQRPTMLLLAAVGVLTLLLLVSVGVAAVWWRRRRRV